jgi:D-threo-aldose 1-dehydrogenase
LPRRTLGATGLRVTPLCLGCAEIGDMVDTFAYSVPEDRALQTVRAAFASPLNFLDTAASYGDGESERRIGLVLREMGGLPDGYVLSTKADRDLQSGDFSGDQFRRSVERSIRLLGLERLQIVFMHDPEHTTFEAAMAPGGPVDVLQRFKAEGVIDHVGVAGGPIDLLMRFVETGVFEAVITHNRYTLLNQSAAPLIDMAHQRGLGVLNAAPYGSGLLAKGPRAYPRYAYTDAPGDLVRRAEAIEAACQEYGVPLAAVALQFSLRDPRITSTIVGMSRPERLAQTLQLASLSLPDALWSRLEEYVGPPVDPEAVRWRRA